MFIEDIFFFHQHASVQYSHTTFLPLILLSFQPQDQYLGQLYHFESVSGAVRHSVHHLQVHLALGVLDLHHYHRVLSYFDCALWGRDVLR
jgi:hypothetical protein